MIIKHKKTMRENIYTWALLVGLLCNTWPEQGAERKDILADSVCNLKWQWSHYCQQDSAQLAYATSQRTQLDTRQGQDITSETDRCQFEDGASGKEVIYSSSDLNNCSKDTKRAWNDRGAIRVRHEWQYITLPNQRGLWQDKPNPSTVLANEVFFYDELGKEIILS